MVCERKMQKVEEKKKEAFVFADAVRNAPHVPPTCSLWYISDLLGWIMFFFYGGLLTARHEVDFDFHLSILLGTMAMHALWGIVELRMQWKWIAYKDVLLEWVDDTYTMPATRATVEPIPQRENTKLMVSPMWVFVILSVFVAPFYIVFLGIVTLVTNHIAQLIRFLCFNYGTVEEAMFEVIEEYY